MLKTIYELIINPLSLPLNPILEYFIILLIGEITHKFAYSFSPGGIFGSIIYWMTKLFTFVVTWVILYFFILVIKFVVNL